VEVTCAELAAASIRECSTDVTGVRRRWEGEAKSAGVRIVLAATGCGESTMKAAIGVKVAFGILALYMSIPLTILAAQRIEAAQRNVPQTTQQARASLTGR
jgi:hypothetical protein